MTAPRPLYSSCSASTSSTKIDIHMPAALALLRRKNLYLPRVTQPNVGGERCPVDRPYQAVSTVSREIGSKDYFQVADDVFQNSALLKKVRPQEVARSEVIGRKTPLRRTYARPFRDWCGPDWRWKCGGTCTPSPTRSAGPG